MKHDRYDSYPELAGSLSAMHGGIRLLDTENAEYLVPLKRLAAVAQEDAFVVSARDGTPRSLASLAYPIRVLNRAAAAACA